MNVSASVIAQAIAAQAAKAFPCGGEYRLPSGACTSVAPSNWTWQCAPGIGNDAACVGVPEQFQVPPPSGLMPAPLAPPPRVVMDDLLAEEPTQFPPWSRCGFDPPAVAASGKEAVQSAAHLAGWFGCFLLSVAVIGAATDVFGGKK